MGLTNFTATSKWNVVTGRLSVRPGQSWNIPIPKCRRRVPAAETRASHNPTERSGSLHLPQKSVFVLAVCAPTEVGVDSPFSEDQTITSLSGPRGQIPGPHCSRCIEQSTLLLSHRSIARASLRCFPTATILPVCGLVVPLAKPRGANRKRQLVTVVGGPSALAPSGRKVSTIHPFWG